MSKLKEELMKRGMSGRDLARTLGRNQSYVQEVLRGVRPATGPMVKQIGEQLGLDPEGFFDEGRFAR